MGHILATLFPVFAIIGLGFVLARTGFLSGAFLRELNSLVYRVCLPAMIIHSLAETGAFPKDILPSLLVFFGATFGVIGVALLNARLLGLERRRVGTFVQAAFRGNLAFIGIPIIVYAVRDQPAEVVNSIVSRALFIFAPIMILYNVASVIALVGSQAGGLSGNVLRSLRNIATNPLILAALTGVVIFLLPVRLPVPIANTLDFIGHVAAPAALICVGGAMAVVSMEGRYRSALYAGVLKTGITPLFALLLSLPFGLDPTTLMILMVYASTPTAVASYVMAREMHGDEAMAAGGIVISTLLSVGSLAIVVGLFS